MSQINRGNISRLTQEGLAGLVGLSYTQHEKQFSRIFDVKDTKKAYEVVQAMDALAPASQKDEGANFDYQLYGQSFNPKYIPVTYATGVSWSKEAAADELYGLFEDRAKMLGFSMAQAKEIYHAAILSRAFNSSYTMPGGDGKEMCATDHSKGPSGGTFSNELTVGADLSATSLQDMLILIGTATDSRGNKIALKGTDLIVTPANMFVAHVITSSVNLPGSADNDINAIKSMGCVRSVIVNNYIDETGAWFMKTNAMKGLTSYQREAMSVENDNDFNSRSIRCMAAERYCAGWTDPRGIYGSV